MKLFSWLRFIVVATGAAQLTVDSSAVIGERSSDSRMSRASKPDAGDRPIEEARLSKLWEMRTRTPQLEEYIQPPPIDSYNRASERQKTDIRQQTNKDPRLGRDVLSKSYGYGGKPHHGHHGHHSGHYGGHKGTYYYAQPLYYPPRDPGFGVYKPIFFVLVVPLFLILFFVAIVAVVRIVASSSSSSAAAAAQQQQQQQSDNNNNNNADNNNNNAAVVSSVSGSSFPFFIIINATGRALEERMSFKRPMLFVHHDRDDVQIVKNETFLLT